ncbi:dATP/dGTP pyrophosphohydrolase domain-containing protein [Bradyrhizobium sp. Ec3.3]|uniref:dATP/dGTP pyrophosphohydrolase domain-containing protein n=1 Tax=Bradyrhizobium sp. Ec3.3 TaxID=189753 RepID=UPI00048188B8|nr:dATP/dGTP pyrophosphohydrolase domain-containing protein [Bradyrhizobium sp. Ec3.3]
MTELILHHHLHRQRDFSERTFGPYSRPLRTEGAIDHIKKEVREIEANPADLEEWIDLAILSFEGALSQGYSPEAIAAALEAKQTKNENRKWPDWRSVEPGKAIEHDRTAEVLERSAYP